MLIEHEGRRPTIAASAYVAPTAVVCGDADRSTPPRYSEFLQAKIAGARLTLIPGAGHMVALEAPASTFAALAIL